MSQLQVQQGRRCLYCIVLQTYNGSERIDINMLSPQYHGSLLIQGCLLPRVMTQQSKYGTQMK